jgi:hypothetical protein
MSNAAQADEAGTPARRGAGGTITLADVSAAIGAEAIWCPDPSVPVTGVVTADLMSDVLVDARPGFVLITGLVTVQAIRTAAIADLAAVVFARGKAVPAEVVDLARETRVPAFTSRRSLFEAAGLLYASLGIRAAEAPGRTA